MTMRYLLILFLLPFIIGLSTIDVEFTQDSGYGLVINEETLLATLPQDFDSYSVLETVIIDNTVFLNISLTTNNQTSTVFIPVVLDRTLTSTETQMIQSNSLTIYVKNISKYSVYIDCNDEYKEYIANTLIYQVVDNEYDASVIISCKSLFAGFFGMHGYALEKPFESFIESHTKEKRHIDIVAGHPTGLVNGLKELAALQLYFIESDFYVHVGGVQALKTWDLYQEDMNNWKRLSLYGAYEKTIIPVESANGISLRIMNIKPLTSQKYIKYTTNNISQPVVFAAGLWNNLTTFQEFGQQMSDEGRNVYLAEITGGPGQDCETCINYNYSDLTQDFWPALIASIQTREQTQTVQYVGYSNGCRSALSSLEIYNEVGYTGGAYFENGVWTNATLTANPVDTFIGIACPGAFEGFNPVQNYITRKNKEESMILKLNNWSRYHNSKEELVENFIYNNTEYTDNNPTISLGLLTNYLNFIEDNNDIQPGHISINNAHIIHGTLGIIPTDIIATVEDSISIYQNINSDQKSRLVFYNHHGNIIESKQVQKITQKLLNNESLGYEKCFYQIEPYQC